MRPIEDSPSMTPPPQRTAWHSPVPYLFGGLAAMLGLIAFALLILACSYWKLSVHSEREERDLEDSENAQNHQKNSSSGKEDESKVYEEKILVIMAGDEKPTFLATPVSAKVSGFRDCDVSGFKLPNTDDRDQTGEICGKVKEMSHHENDHDEEEQEA